VKKNKHPESNLACYEDVSNGVRFLTRTTQRSKRKITIEGAEYEHILCDVTSSSHPAYTGEKRFVDTAGRVEKFQQRTRRKKA